MSKRPHADHDEEHCLRKLQRQAERVNRKLSELLSARRGASSFADSEAETVPGDPGPSSSVPSFSAASSPSTSSSPESPVLADFGLPPEVSQEEVVEFTPEELALLVPQASLPGVASTLPPGLEISENGGPVLSSDADIPEDLAILVSVFLSSGVFDL